MVALRLYWSPDMRRLLMTLSRFRSDRRGNIAILFGLLIIPVFGIMGAALDYSYANSDRTRIQAALDNTALALSKMMPISDDQLNEKGWEIFNANLGTTDLKFDQSDFQIVPSANGKMRLQLNSIYTLRVASVLKQVGIAPTLNVGASTEVQWGNTRLRVALALDNTGSMAQDGKMDALKTATTKFIQQMKDASKTDGDVYVSIVPFSKDVNIDSSNYTENWIDWTSWDAANGSCTISGNKSQSKCEADSQDNGTCSNTKYTTKKKCTDNNARWTAKVVNGVWTPADHKTWNGCVTDRGTNSNPGTNDGYDQKVDLPIIGNTETMWPAEQFSSCTLAVKGLTYDWDGLNTLVDDMKSVGNTNTPIGLVWAWQSLVGGGPFDTVPPQDPDYAYSKTIILMSDGENTQNRWTSTVSGIDRRMYYKNGSTISGTCKNIKDAGIQIFAVQVNTGGDPTSTLLQNCASDPSMFFELKKADALVDTFKKIGSALANIHLSK